MPRPKTLPDTPENVKRRGDYTKYRSGREWARKKILKLELELADLKIETARQSKQIEDLYYRIGQPDSFRPFSNAPLRVVADQSIKSPGPHWQGPGEDWP